MFFNKQKKRKEKPLFNTKNQKQNSSKSKEKQNEEKVIYKIPVGDISEDKKRAKEWCNDYPN